MGRPEYIFKSEKPRDAAMRDGDGVCCALAPQLVIIVFLFTATIFDKLKVVINYLFSNLSSGSYYLSYLKKFRIDRSID